LERGLFIVVELPIFYKQETIKKSMHTHIYVVKAEKRRGADNPKIDAAR
jgi:hypothetical protein